MKTSEEWAIYNEDSGKVWYVNSLEFKGLLDTHGLDVTGEFITINVYHNRVKVWIDGRLKKGFFQ